MRDRGRRGHVASVPAAALGPVPAAAVDPVPAAAVGPVRGRRGRQELRRGVRPRGAPSAAGRGAGGLRADRRVQAGPVGVRGRVVPAGGAAAPVRPGRAARPDGRAQGDGRRAVGQRVQDVRGRARARSRGGGGGVPVRVPAAAAAGGPVAVLLPSRLQQQSSAGRPQVDGRRERTRRHDDGDGRL